MQERREPDRLPDNRSEQASAAIAPFDGMAGDRTRSPWATTTGAADTYERARSLSAADGRAGGRAGSDPAPREDGLRRDGRARRDDAPGRPSQPDDRADG